MSDAAVEPGFAVIGRTRQHIAKLVQRLLCAAETEQRVGAIVEDVGVARLAQPIYHAINDAVVENQQRAAIAAHRHFDSGQRSNLLRPAARGVHDDLAGEEILFAGKRIAEAHAFIDYLLRPDVAARNSDLIKYANAVAPDIQPLDPAVRDDPGVYPPPEVRARLTPERARPPEYQRLLTRMWTRFKTGR